MHYYSLNEYLKQTYGEKVYKISLNGGMTCPNRDGTCGTKGCIFCSQGGSGEFASDGALSVTAQIDYGISKVRSKFKGDKFIAYFQAYTNTYAPVAYLEELFTQAICHDNIVGLSIATRPDCLNSDVLTLLDKLNTLKPVWVELGLQTIHEQTAKYIRRGYPLSVYDQAVSDLRKINVHIVTHVILGLPFETKEDMLATVDYVGQKTDGIKLQLLHVLKDTDLETEYIQHTFDILSLEEYIDILAEAIARLPKHTVIHRITGDGDKRQLIAPLWSGNKKLVLNTITKAFRHKNVVQGTKNYKKL